MQITLLQPEIEQALQDYVSQQGINLNGQTVTVVFTAGRKKSGISAELSIYNAASTTPLPTQIEIEFNAETTDEEEPEEEVAEVVIPVQAVTSLFG